MSLLVRKGHTYLISCTLYSTAIIWLRNELLFCYVTSVSSFFPTCYMISRQLLLPKFLIRSALASHGEFLLGTVQYLVAKKTTRQKQQRKKYNFEFF